MISAFDGSALVLFSEVRSSGVILDAFLSIAIQVTVCQVSLLPYQAVQAFDSVPGLQGLSYSDKGNVYFQTALL